MKYAVKAAPSPDGADEFEFVMSDDSVDRVGDVIEASGWKLKNFRAHPIALMNHDRDQIIGKWVNVRISGNQLLGKLELAQPGTSPLVDTVRSLVQQKILRAVSVGFKPIKAEPLDEDDDPWGPLRFIEQELLECSLVAVPANPNALSTAKALNLPPQLLAEVFRKPASEVRPAAAASTGKPAKSLVQKSTNMHTIAQRIQNAQQNFNILRDALNELAAKDELNEEEQTRYEQLPDQIEKARLEIDKHKRAEKALVEDEHQPQPAVAAVAAVTRAAPELLPPTGEAAGKPGETRRMFALPKKKIEPGDYVMRALACWSKSQATKDTLDKSLREMYGGDEATGIVLRAAVNPANTTVATWAAELVQTSNVDFLDRLIPDAIYPQLAGMGVRYTFGNSAVLKIPVRTTTNTLAGNWVGEGAPKPVRRASFATVSMSPTKLAVISTFTEEMAAYSTPAIEGIIRQAMSDDTGIALDTYLIDAVAGTVGVRPPGLLNGVTPITASAATPPTAAMVADLKALVNAIVAAGGGRNIAILINPAQALSLGFAQTTTGDFLFTDRAEAGSKFGVRFIVSATVPAGKVIAVDAADFATANGDAPRFAVSTEATLHEEDTTPLALSATGTPNVVAAPMRSLFQTDAVAIRMSLYVSWIMRRAGMVQTIAAVSW